MHSLFLLFCITADAGDYKKGELQPKAITDLTAYTVPKKTVKLGLVNQEYGLLENASVGTQLWTLALGIYTANAKVTAIQTPKLDASLEGGIFYYDANRVGLPAIVTMTPIGWTGSWKVSDTFSAHFGHSWTMASVDGELSAAEIATALEPVLGADVSADLTAALGDGTGAYAGANLTLVQARIAADWRLNRRDSVVVFANTYLFLTGIAAAGGSVEAEGAEIDVGASARFRLPLQESLTPAAGVSWQWSWERFHLRVGLPLSQGSGFLLAIPCAFQAYWLLGPKRSEPMEPVAAPEAEPDAPQDEPTEP